MRINSVDKSLPIKYSTDRSKSAPMDLNQSLIFEYQNSSQVWSTITSIYQYNVNLYVTCTTVSLISMVTVSPSIHFVEVYVIVLSGKNNKIVFCVIRHITHYHTLNMGWWYNALSVLMHIMMMLLNYLCYQFVGLLVIWTLGLLAYWLYGRTHCFMAGRVLEY